MFNGYEFALGLVLGFIFSVYAIRYFEKHYPQHRPTLSAGGVPYFKKKIERKKPVVIDEAKEWRMEQEQREKGR